MDLAHRFWLFFCQLTEVPVNPEEGFLFSHEEKVKAVLVSKHVFAKGVEYED